MCFSDIIICDLQNVQNALTKVLHNRQCGLQVKSMIFNYLHTYFSKVSFNNFKAILNTINCKVPIKTLKEVFAVEQKGTEN